MLGKNKSRPREKKPFKAPNAYVIIFLFLVLAAVLTWIIPGGQYQLDESGNAIAGTYSQTESNPQGLWDIVMAPIIGMCGNDLVDGAISISLSIMLFGSFLEIMNESGSIKLLLKRVADKNKASYHRLIWILVFLMGALGTIYGAYEESFVYLLMLMPVILSLGLDTMVTVMIVVFGTQGGCLASVVNPFATGIAAGIAGISPGEGILMRFIVFVVILSLISAYICRYADKVKKDPTLSSQYYRREQDLKEFPVAEDEDLTMTKEQSRVVVVFCVTFAIMIISLIPWSSLNENWTFFEDFAAWLTGLPVIGTVLGKSITPFGQWYFNEQSLLVLVATFVVGFVMHYKVDKIIDITVRGAAGLVSTAFIVPLSRGIQVIMTTGSITPTILNFGEQTLSTLPPVLFVLVCLVFYFLIAILIPSSSGLAAATMSIMAPLAVFAGIEPEMMILIYIMGLGMVKMIMPTSIAVMTCTQVAHIDYGQWVKTNWKFMLVMFAACCVLLVAGIMI